MSTIRPKFEHFRNAIGGAGVIAVVLAFAIGTFAATLDDYQKRVGTTREMIEDLRAAEADLTAQTSVEHEKISVIRNLLPRSEKVEWPSGSIETDNAWLHTGLDSVEAEVNISRRSVIFGQIDERLSAVQEKINEIEAASAGTRSKDEDKRKLAEILRREEYQKPAEKEESLFQRWQRQFMEWLRNMFPKLNIQPQDSSGLSSLSFLLQIMLYAALAAGIIYLIYRFLPFFSGRFGNRTKRSKNERVILGERIGDDESATDLFAEAERLALNGELRLAIRKGYIALLCDLNDRKIIGLARHKTNRDYLRDLRSKHELFENVRGLTGSFERHWYGTQASDDTAWQEFRDLYRRTMRGV